MFSHLIVLKLMKCDRASMNGKKNITKLLRICHVCLLFLENLFSVALLNRLKMSEHGFLNVIILVPLKVIGNAQS